MNLVQKRQFQKNMDDMKLTSGQCAERIEWLLEHTELSEDQRSALDAVLIHQKNMVYVFANLSGKK